MKFFKLLLLTLLLGGCVVESGNPTGADTKGKGKISVDFVKTSTSTFGLLGFETSSIDLLGKDATGRALRESLQTQKADDQNDFISLISGASIEPGTYHAIILTLAEGSKLFVREKETDQEFPARFVNDATSITIDTHLVVKEGEQAKITIQLNLDQSLTKETDTYIISPKMDVDLKSNQASYSKNLHEANASIACAYRYETSKTQSLNDIKAKDIPSFPSKEDLKKDSEASCKLAFARSGITDGIVQFDYLPAGTYDIRVFYKDGSFKDIETGLSLGQK